jgi:hypothetical protein
MVFVASLVPRRRQPSAKVFVFLGVLEFFARGTYGRPILIREVKPGYFLLWPQVEADSLDSLVNGFSNWTRRMSRGLALFQLNSPNDLGAAILKPQTYEERPDQWRIDAEVTANAPGA